ncbi:DUF1048 domain-containing protein [Proteiniborus sp. MB09-C3]|uniref:DUF1048 domain-containing protein n=1 Tax=Proteiniborus sp. MB09-C3 TaxID=3050072 RepID=UPI002556A629|nr:DUF1048 domain-containing protein [Proteiniborus sp. MB09-C3]WIV12787.1 DUF1048 domain-containing protein [Proteiniborus sp. MB09-C3]
MLMEIRLRKIRARQQRKLNSSYLALYKNITSYIHLSTLKNIEKEEILQEILDIMLQAQLEGKSIDSFIGADYEMFCDSVIKEYSKSHDYRILNAFQGYIKYTILGLLAFALINAISSQSLSSLSITISQFIVINAISIFIVPLSKKIQKERISAPKYQKYYVTVNNIKGIYVLIAFIGFPMIFKAILEKMYGKEILGYKISLLANWHYLILAIVAIASIEIYKRLRCSN